MSKAKRCKGVKKNGTRCQGIEYKGTGYCAVHGKQYLAEKAAAYLSGETKPMENGYLRDEIEEFLVDGMRGEFKEVVPVGGQKTEEKSMEPAVRLRFAEALIRLNGYDKQEEKATSATKPKTVLFTPKNKKQ